MGPSNRHWGCSDPWQSRWKWEFRRAHQVSGNVFGAASWLGLLTCCTPRVWSTLWYPMWAISNKYSNCLNFHCFSNKYCSVENESLPDYTTCFLFDGVVESLINVYLSFSINFMLKRIWFWETDDVTGSCWNSWKFYRSATWRRFLWWISCKGAWKDGSSMIWQNARSDVLKSRCLEKLQFM